MENWMQGLLAIVLILIGLYVGSLLYAKYSGPQQVLPANNAAACAAAGGIWSAVTSMCTLQPTSQTQIIGCPSGLAALNVYSAAKNPLNATSDYMAAAITITQATAYGTDEFGPWYPAATTDTTTAGTTLAYRTTAVGCVAELYTAGVRVVATGNVLNNGYISDPQLLSSGATSFSPLLIETPRTANNLTIVIRDISFTNTSFFNNTLTGLCITGGGNCSRAPVVNETGATAMTTGDTRTVYIDLQFNASAEQFGSTQFGMIFAIDTVQANAFGDKDVALSSTDPGNFPVTEIPCPARLVAFISANRCYKAPALTSQMGLVRLKETFTASLGNPTLGPVTYIEDIQPYTDTDGQIHIGCFDAGGTNVGAIQYGFWPQVS